MLVLRYIIEDKEVLKAIVRNEIRTWFQSGYSGQINTQSFVHHNHHLVLRDPDAFFDLANKPRKSTKYDPHPRSQKIAIKERERPKPESESKLETGSDLAKGTEEPVKETDDKETVDIPKPVAEVKPPGLENTDGVIHLVLSEPLAKDAIDDPLPSNLRKEDIAWVSWMSKWSREKGAVDILTRV